MASLTITELLSLGFDPHGNPIMAPEVPAARETSVPIAGASEQSDPFGATTRYVMVNTDTQCCLAWGMDPEAVGGLHRMGAGETRFYTVKPGHKLAVIQGP